MITQEDLDTLKLHYGSIAPNKVMELIEAYEQSRKWANVWKEAAILNRYRANNWLSLARTYSRELGRVRQWTQTWKRAAKKQRENFNRLYKVALATVETHETVKTYGEDATETNE